MRYDSSPKPQLTHALKYSIGLANIFQDIMAQVFSPKTVNLDSSSILYRLGELNVRLGRWHAELPDCLRWTHSLSQHEPVPRHIATIQ
jgi:hypothetical protein